MYLNITEERGKYLISISNQLFILRWKKKIKFLFRKNFTKFIPINQSFLLRNRLEIPRSFFL